MSLEAYRALGYAGLSLWTFLLLEFIFWKTIRRRFLQKPIQIPADVGEAGREEYLAGKRTEVDKLIKLLRRVSYGLGISLILSSLGTCIMAVLGAVVRKHFFFESIIMAAVLLPAYFSNLHVVSMMQDMRRQMDRAQYVFKKAPAWAGGTFAGPVNLLPLLALAPLLYLAPWPELPQRLGFGLAAALAVMVLSLIFIKARATSGVWLNIILLSFVYLAYLLPHADQAKKLLPFREFFLILILPFVVAFGAGFLVSYPLVKKRGALVFSQQQQLFSYYTQVPMRLSVVAFFAGFLGQLNGLLQFSYAFAAGQALVWLVVLVGLFIKEYRGKVDFNAVRDYIVKEKGLRLELGSTTLVAYLMLFLAAGTLFESFRGLWLLWAGSALWLILILACLWKVWRYAFVESQG